MPGLTGTPGSCSSPASSNRCSTCCRSGSASGSLSATSALPAARRVGFAFAGAGMAATTFMRSWQHFEFVTLATLPMFLFSTTFYPLSVYPRPVQIVVECTPLYQGVSLIRGLTLGAVGPGLLWPVAYLAVMGLTGLYVAGRRISALLLR